MKRRRCAVFSYPQLQTSHSYLSRYISHLTCERSQSFEKWCHFIKIASGITHLDLHSNFAAIQSIVGTQQHRERNAVQHSFGIQCKWVGGLCHQCAGLKCKVSSQDEGTEKNSLIRTQLRIELEHSLFCQIYFRYLKSSTTRVLQLFQQHWLSAINKSYWLMVLPNPTPEHSEECFR